jgi:hypothetical protein
MEKDKGYCRSGRKKSSNRALEQQLEKIRQEIGEGIGIGGLGSYTEYIYYTYKQPPSTAFHSN